MDTRAKIEQIFDHYAARTNQALGEKPVVDVDGVPVHLPIAFSKPAQKGWALVKTMHNSVKPSLKGWRFTGISAQSR